VRDTEKDPYKVRAYLRQLLAQFQRGDMDEFECKNYKQQYYL
jgi:hypothetical protein